jgi:chromosome segregation ATPase
MCISGRLLCVLNILPKEWGGSKMLGYWKRQYDMLYQKYCHWVDQNNALVSRNNTLEYENKRLGGVLERAEQRNQELELESQELDAMLTESQDQVSKLSGEINMRDVKIQQMQRYIDNVHSAFKVMQDVIDPAKKSENA